MTGTPQIEERREADAEADWYQAAPGTWMPREDLDGAPLERIRLPDTKHRSRTQIYYDAVLEVCQRPAPGPVVVQMLTNMRPNAVPWLRRLKANGVAVLYSVSQFPTWPQKPVKRIFRSRGYRRVYNEFDALVTNSETLKDFLREIGVTTRIEYIPNGVNLQRFHPVQGEIEKQGRQALRARFGIPEDHRVIAVVGAIMPRKGSDDIIRAWQIALREHPDSHVLFVGPRADTHDPKLKAFGQKIAGLIETSGAPNQVHFAGVVDDVESYLRASDLFILASRREGTPNSVLEAMASQLPCLVTPYIGISPGIGTAGEHYQLVDRNPEAIATAISDLLRDPSTRNALAERGRRFVLDNVDQRASLDRYVELYRELGMMAAARRGRGQ
jgi:glycosyltransferase involved in cell wall biosynthesis